MQALTERIALTDANDLTKTETIINVADGMDGATSFVYDNDYEMLSIKNMQEVPYTVTHTIELIGLPNSDVNTANLDAFADPDTDSRIAMIGTDGALIAQETVKCEYIDKHNDGLFWRFKVTFKTLPYREIDDSRKGGGLHVGENLLALYKFVDSDSDGVADGFTNDGFDSASFSNGVQSLSANADGGTARLNFEKLFFPFDGDQLTFAINVDAYTNNGHSESILIEYLDETGSVTQTDSVSVSSTGRKIVNSTIPSDAVEVVVAFRSNDTGSASGTSDYELSDPLLSVDGDDTYREY